MASQVTYKEIRKFEYPNMVVRVHIPDLTEDERSKRMKTVHKAAEELLKSTLSIKKNATSVNHSTLRR